MHHACDGICDGEPESRMSGPCLAIGPGVVGIQATAPAPAPAPAPVCPPTTHSGCCLGGRTHARPVRAWAYPQSYVYLSVRSGPKGRPVLVDASSRYTSSIFCSAQRSALARSAARRIRKGSSEERQRGREEEERGKHERPPPFLPPRQLGPATPSPGSPPPPPPPPPAFQAIR